MIKKLLKVLFYVAVAFAGFIVGIISIFKIFGKLGRIEGVPDVIKNTISDFIEVLLFGPRIRPGRRTYPNYTKYTNYYSDIARETCEQARRYNNDND